MYSSFLFQINYSNFTNQTVIFDFSMILIITIYLIIIITILVIFALTFQVNYLIQ